MVLQRACVSRTSCACGAASEPSPAPRRLRHIPIVQRPSAPPCWVSTWRWRRPKHSNNARNSGRQAALRFGGGDGRKGRLPQSEGSAGHRRGARAGSELPRPPLRRPRAPGGRPGPGRHSRCHHWSGCAAAGRLRPAGARCEWGRWRPGPRGSWAHGRRHRPASSPWQSRWWLCEARLWWGAPLRGARPLAPAPPTAPWLVRWVLRRSISFVWRSSGPRPARAGRHCAAAAHRRRRSPPRVPPAARSQVLPAFPEGASGSLPEVLYRLLDPAAAVELPPPGVVHLRGELRRPCRLLCRRAADWLAAARRWL